MAATPFKVRPDLALCAIALASSGFVAAQQAPAGGQTALERQTEETFRQLLERPTDRDLLSRYSGLQVEAGNYEGGIAALERLLLDPQTPPRIRVDLAYLYFKLRSYAMAQSLLETALDKDNLSAADKAVALNLLRETKRLGQKSVLTGVVTLGLRRQSNPTYATDAGRIYSGGVLVNNPPTSLPKSDRDWNIAGRINHEYDLELDSYAKLISSAGISYTDYNSYSGSRLQLGNTKPLDLTVLDASTGIQLRPFKNSESVLVRPYVALTNILAQGHPLLNVAGLGLDVSGQVDNVTYFQGAVEWQDRRFKNRVDSPTADLNNGQLWSLTGTLARDLGKGQFGSLTLSTRRISGQRQYLDSTGYDLRVNYQIAYAAPVGAGNWVTGLSASVGKRKYGGPDPAVLSTQTRKDNETRVGFSQTFPLAEQWSLILLADQVRNAANLPNYEFRNTSVSANVQYSF